MLEKEEIFDFTRTMQNMTKRMNWNFSFQVFTEYFSPGSVREFRAVEKDGRYVYVENPVFRGTVLECPIEELALSRHGIIDKDGKLRPSPDSKYRMSVKSRMLPIAAHGSREVSTRVTNWIVPDTFKKKKKSKEDKKVKIPAVKAQRAKSLGISEIRRRLRSASAVDMFVWELRLSAEQARLSDVVSRCAFAMKYTNDAEGSRQLTETRKVSEESLHRVKECLIEVSSALLARKTEKAMFDQINTYEVLKNGHRVATKAG